MKSDFSHHEGEPQCDSSERSPHPLLLSEEGLRQTCRLQFLKGSGPGGQHRNKVETAVRWTHLPSGITGEASERRSQTQNRTRAWQRLRVNLALQLRSPQNPERPPFTPPLTLPETVWRRYLRGNQIRISPENPDYPLFLLEFLDIFQAAKGDWNRTAAILQTSVSQLNRFARQEKGIQEMKNRSPFSRKNEAVPCLIGIGGNLGNRRRNIESAWKFLNNARGVKCLRLSSLIETKAAGGPSGQPDFLNAVGLIETSLAPEDLLVVLQNAEKAGGRVRHEHWGARTIDLDLLLYGDRQIATETLTVPHPQICWRPFVLLPAAEIAPDFRHPVMNRTISELARLMAMNFRLAAIFPASREPCLQGLPHPK